MTRKYIHYPRLWKCMVLKKHVLIFTTLMSLTHLAVSTWMVNLTLLLYQKMLYFQFMPHSGLFQPLQASLFEIVMNMLRKSHFHTFTQQDILGKHMLIAQANLLFEIIINFVP